MTLEIEVLAALATMPRGFAPKISHIPSDHNRSAIYKAVRRLCSEGYVLKPKGRYGVMISLAGKRALAKGAETVG